MWNLTKVLMLLWMLLLHWLLLSICYGENDIPLKGGAGVQSTTCDNSGSANLDDGYLEKLLLQMIELQQDNILLRREISELRQKVNELPTSNGLASDMIEVTCNSGTHPSHTNSCKATCPIGSVLISGGCQASHWQWHLSKSMKSGNSWYCEGGEDWGTTVYHREITGFAHCLNER